MKTINSTKGYDGIEIRVGDTAVTENGEFGKVTEIYDDGSLDIHHSNAHQGPVIDFFDIVGHKVHKVDLEY